VVLLVLVALFADVIAPHDPSAMSITHRLLWPVWTGAASHPDFLLLGTDGLGRDILSR
jgi:peptide/nickel transport system permease protein